MINITVYSQNSVDIEQKNYSINHTNEMIEFIKDLLDKIYYSREKICLEECKINSEKGVCLFHEIQKW